jgi:hypothetical protein
MRRWWEKIRASTPLHVVFLAEIFAPPLYYTSRRIPGPDAINPLPPARSSQPAPPPARACPNYRSDLGAAGGAPSRGPRRQGGPEGGAAEMRRDAVPPPIAPSASSSSSSLFSGGEQLFESGPSPLVFLPLLLIQGGGMDISRVGEKLLSSVRSLGLLPPTPAAPPSRPEVLYAFSLLSWLALAHCRFQNELRQQQQLHGRSLGCHLTRGSTCHPIWRIWSPSMGATPRARPWRSSRRCSMRR